MPAHDPRGRGSWPVARLVLAVLLVLLVAAGVYARAHTSFPFRAAPQLSPTAVTITFLVVEAIGLALAVFLTLTRRRRRQRADDDEGSWLPINRWIIAAVNLTVFFLVLLLASWIIKHFRDEGRARSLLPSVAPSAGHRPGLGSLPPGARTLWLIWLGVVVLAAVVVVVALWRRNRGGPPQLPVAEDEPEVDAGGAALRAGRRALDAPTDPRSAVIACYEAMERSLAEAGVERAPAQTPEELLAGLRGRHVVASERAARTLVELFGRARFSSRPVDAADVATARSALAELLADARAAEARP